MPRTRFAPRVFVLMVIALVVAAVCVRLGIWQLHRLSERRAYNASVRLGLAQAPVPLPSLPQARYDPGAVTYRRVEVSGTYDSDRQVVLYGRSLNEQPGSHVLTPLVTEDARAILIDRGWIPIEIDPADPRAGAPGGPVTVAGVLFPSEGDPPGAPPASVDAEASRTVSRVDLAGIQKLVPDALYPEYLLLQSQQPPQPGPLPEPGTLPELSEGPHLSYAIQWFSFAAIALVGCAILVRNDVRATPSPSQEQE